MYHDLNEKASKHETELIWLAWELEQMLLLKANNKTNGDRSLNLFIFSGFVSWKANLVFQFTRNRQFTKNSTMNMSHDLYFIATREQNLRVKLKS